MRIISILYLILVFTISLESVVFASAAGRADEAEELYEREKYGEALSAYSDAQMEDPGNHLLQFNLGNAHYRLNDYESAQKSYLGTANSPDPGLQARAFYNLGNTAYRQGKLDEAIEWYQRALDMNPDDEDAKFNLEFVREELRRRINESQKQKDQQQEGQCQQEPQEGGQGEEQKEQQQNEQQQKMAQGEEKQQETEEQGGAGQEKEEKQLSQEEAEQWLGVLDEDQKDFLKKQAQKGVARQRRPVKDW